MFKYSYHWGQTKEDRRKIKRKRKMQWRNILSTYNISQQLCAFFFFLLRCKIVNISHFFCFFFPLFRAGYQFGHGPRIHDKDILYSNSRWRINKIMSTRFTFHNIIKLIHSLYLQIVKRLFLFAGIILKYWGKYERGNEKHR